MAGIPIFSSDFEMLYRSQVKCLVYAGVRRRNHVLEHLELFSTRLPVKVFKTLNSHRAQKTAVELKKVLSVTKHGFVF